MFAQLRPALVTFGLLTVLTGAVYPAVVTGLAQVVFPRQANGSLVSVNDAVVGSELIGQSFAGDRFFWPRPSATTPAYNATASSGSNLGPTNPDLLKAVEQRLDNLKKAHPDQTGPVPIDLVTASASGLDPHISPAAAHYQVSRVAKARGLKADEVRRLVDRFTEGRTLGVLGESRVNVLRLNLALEKGPRDNLQ